MAEASSSSKPWFAAKRYDYGSSLPITWQGWLAMVATIVVVAICAVALAGVARIVVSVLAILAFALLCAFKTEGGWRWRWGERR
jgi:hypothetical protein